MFQVLALRQSKGLSFKRSTQFNQNALLYSPTDTAHSFSRNLTHFSFVLKSYLKGIS